MRLSFFVGPRTGGVRPGGLVRRAELLRHAPHARRTGARKSAGSIVYVLAGMNGLCKVGASTNLDASLAQARAASPFQADFAFVASVPGSAGFEIENAAHLVLAHHRIASDWFEVSPDAAIAAVKDAARKTNTLPHPLSPRMVAQSLAEPAVVEPLETGDNRRSVLGWLLPALKFTAGFVGGLAIIAMILLVTFMIKASVPHF